jgi:parallel beta-helix repeat protein
VGIAGPGGSDGYGVFIYNGGGRTCEISLYENTFTGNDYGLYLLEGAGCATLTKIFHNNFIGSLKAQVNDSTALSIYGEYPGGGNYWDDFDQAEEGASDVFHGVYQDVDGADGIVDTPYTGVEGGLHEDSYPLMSIYSGALSADVHGPFEGAVGFPVQFISSTSGGFPPYSWLWDFGDPAHHTSTDPSPLFAYGEVGTYSVAFMVTDSQGTSIINVTTATIQVMVADAHGPYTGFINIPVQFTGSVLGGTPDYTWLWEFGDGTTSSVQNPTHAYTEDGVYDVTLTVTDSQQRQYTDSTTATVLGTPLLVHVDDDFNNSTPGWGYNCFATIQEGITAVPHGGSVYVAAGQYNENVVVNKSINLYGERQQTTVIAGKTPGTAVSISASSVNLSGFTVYTHKVLQKGIGIIGNSKYNVITNNTILKGNENEMYDIGIYISSSSSHNTLCRNMIENTYVGIFLEGSSNTITENTLINNNNRGIVAYYDTFQNLFFLNNFLANKRNAQDLESNSWDNGTMGNYWDDYTGVDENSDGIGDTPYQIPGGNNFDYYPLMEPYGLFHVDAHGPYSGTVDESIQLNGSASGGSPPYTWLWEFGDNTMNILRMVRTRYNSRSLIVKGNETLIRPQRPSQKTPCHLRLFSSPHRKDIFTFLISFH